MYLDTQRLSLLRGRFDRACGCAMTWDYIVIGAGSAGCALAYQLAQSDRRKRILILEAGGSDRSPFIKIPAGVLQACARYDWGYRSQPDPSRYGAVDKWLRGRVLGGSSSINGMVYIRGAAGDFDRWDESCGHVGRWSAKDVLPLFQAMEHSDQNGPLRGRAGPLHVTTVKRPHAVTQAFVESARAAGVPFNDDYNGESQEGVSYMQRSVRQGLRWSAADAFLKPLIAQGRVEVRLHSEVRRIEIAHGRAHGVTYTCRGKPLEATARDIVLCAGALNSPKILMLSGVGDPRALAAHGIQGVLNLPGVGQNLIEQPMVSMSYRSRVPTYNLTEGILQRLQIAAKFLKHREGPISSAFESTAFLKTLASSQVPDTQLLFFPVGYRVSAEGTYKLAPYPAFTTYVIRSHPLSRGQIRLASSDPEQPPLIECRLLEREEDVDALVRGINAVRRIMHTAPIASIIDEETAPGAGISHMHDLREFVREHAEITFHPIGTCRMGVGADAVVDPFLRVRGIENLWIGDASIMPDHISANINAACMMIGTKLGKQLAHRG